MKKAALRFRTVVLSDVHLGTEHCKIEEVNNFLRHSKCQRLILNGDIIDGWALRRRLFWTKEHTRFIRLVLKKAQKKNTEVIYIRGNHDDILARFLPVNLGFLQVVEEYILETGAGRFLCLHGDVFDSVTKHTRFIAVLGDVGYQFLLNLNRTYNRFREWRGQEYYSLSKAIKARVKRAVSHISNFEDHLFTLAKARGCAGVVCGHIHTPADQTRDGIRYLNSGDWVESLTGIVEHLDGRWEVLTYQQFMAMVAEREKELAAMSATDIESHDLPDEEHDHDGELPLPLPVAAAVASVS